MDIHIQLTTAGVDADNFILYYYIAPGPYVQFDTGVSRAILLAGVNYTIPDNSTEVKIVSTGVCTNELIITIDLITTTSTSTSSTTSTSTSTTSTTSSSSTSTSSTTTTDTTTEGTTSTTTSTSSTSTSTSTTSSSTSTSSTTTDITSTSTSTTTSSTSTSTSTSTDTTSTTTTVMVYGMQIKTADDAVSICSTSVYIGRTLSPAFGEGIILYTDETLTTPISGTYIVLDAITDFPVYNLSNGVVGVVTGYTCYTSTTTSSTSTSTSTDTTSTTTTSL